MAVTSGISYRLSSSPNALPCHIFTLYILRFAMLKAWMLNPNLGDIQIEEKYTRYSEEQRKDKFVTVPW